MTSPFAVDTKNNSNVRMLIRMFKNIILKQYFLIITRYMIKNKQNLFFVWVELCQPVICPSVDLTQISVDGILNGLFRIKDA